MQVIAGFEIKKHTCEVTVRITCASPLNVLRRDLKRRNLV